MTTYCWLCDDCGEHQLFIKPTLPQEDPKSELNADPPECPTCGESMYWDEIGEDKQEQFDCME